MDYPFICFLLFQVLLAVYLLLDGFDLGTGILTLFLKDEKKLSSALYAIWPYWNANEVWVLSAFVLLFAAFPPVFSTLLSSLYPGFFLLLAAVILRGVSLEYRERTATPAGRSAFTLLFGTGSLLAALVLGVAAGNIIGGFPPHASLVSMFRPFNLLTGLFSVLVLSWHGSRWLAMKAPGSLPDGVKLGSLAAGISAAVIFVILVFWAASASPYFPEHSRSVPLCAMAVASTVLCWALSFWTGTAGKNRASFLFSSCAVLFCLVSSASAFYPVMAVSDPVLTAVNASADPRNMPVVMTIVLAGLPLAAFLNITVYLLFRGGTPAKH